eukprot:TRINITY_DN16827_c0_g3_i1.p1 TRINITY_DN16827_c0_g3~~TRINITY_DN16827_c0_g3_i1.p1  ORF type:complete len:1434 (-),score=400.58 TRINITY_DN16827_c0_g3_i1:63-3824(-)
MEEKHFDVEISGLRRKVNVLHEELEDQHRRSSEAESKSKSWRRAVDAELRELWGRSGEARAGPGAQVSVDFSPQSPGGVVTDARGFSPGATRQELADMAGALREEVGRLAAEQAAASLETRLALQGGSEAGFRDAMVTRADLQDAAEALRREFMKSMDKLAADLRIELGAASERHETELSHHVAVRTADLHRDLLALREDVGELKVRRDQAHSHMVRGDVERLVEQRLHGLGSPKPANHGAFSSWADGETASAAQAVASLEKLKNEVTTLQEDGEENSSMMRKLSENLDVVRHKLESLSVMLDTSNLRLDTAEERHRTLRDDFEAHRVAAPAAEKRMATTREGGDDAASVPSSRPSSVIEATAGQWTDGSAAATADRLAASLRSALAANGDLGTNGKATTALEPASSSVAVVGGDNASEDPSDEMQLAAIWNAIAELAEIVGVSGHGFVSLMQNGTSAVPGGSETPVLVREHMRGVHDRLSVLEGAHPELKRSFTDVCDRMAAADGDRAYAIVDIREKLTKLAETVEGLQDSRGSAGDDAAASEALQGRLAACERRVEEAHAHIGSRHGEHARRLDATDVAHAELHSKHEDHARRLALCEQSLAAATAGASASDELARRVAGCDAASDALRASQEEHARRLAGCEEVSRLHGELRQGHAEHERRIAACEQAGHSIAELHAKHLDHTRRLASCEDAVQRQSELRLSHEEVARRLGACEQTVEAHSELKAQYADHHARIAKCEESLSSHGELVARHEDHAQRLSDCERGVRATADLQKLVSQLDGRVGSFERSQTLLQCSCGASFSEDAKFCRICGKPRSVASAAPVAPAAPSAPTCTGNAGVGAEELAEAKRELDGRMSSLERRFVDLEQRQQAQQEEGKVALREEDVAALRGEVAELKTRTVELSAAAASAQARAEEAAARSASAVETASSVARGAAGASGAENRERPPLRGGERPPPSASVAAGSSGGCGGAPMPPSILERSPAAGVPALPLRLGVPPAATAPVGGGYGSHAGAGSGAAEEDESVEELDIYGGGVQRQAFTGPAAAATAATEVTDFQAVDSSACSDDDLSCGGSSRGGFGAYGLGSVGAAASAHSSTAVPSASAPPGRVLRSFGPMVQQPAPAGARPPQPGGLGRGSGSHARPPVRSVDSALSGRPDLRLPSLEQIVSGAQADVEREEEALRSARAKRLAMEREAAEARMRASPRGPVGGQAPATAGGNAQDASGTPLLFNPVELSSTRELLHARGRELDSD